MYGAKKRGEGQGLRNRLIAEFSIATELPTVLLRAQKEDLGTGDRCRASQSAIALQHRDDGCEGVRGQNANAGARLHAHDTLLIDFLDWRGSCGSIG